MQDLVAAKAIISSFFIEVSFLDVLRQAAALLKQAGGNQQEADERIRCTLADMLQQRSVECRPDGGLMLHRERYPAALRKELCRPLDEFDFSEVGAGLYKPLKEFPPGLRDFFSKAIENKEMPEVQIDGEPAVPDGVYLPFLDEHARAPFAPLRLFAEHPIADDVAHGTVVPVVRWGVPMISWDDYSPYSPCGASPEDWHDLEVQASLGAS